MHGRRHEGYLLFYNNFAPAVDTHRGTLGEPGSTTALKVKIREYLFYPSVLYGSFWGSLSSFRPVIISDVIIISSLKTAVK